MASVPSNVRAGAGAGGRVVVVGGAVVVVGGTVVVVGATVVEVAERGDGRSVTTDSAGSCSAQEKPSLGHSARVVTTRAISSAAMTPISQSR
jgi:hypothetical protein